MRRKGYQMSRKSPFLGIQHVFKLKVEDAAKQVIHTVYTIDN